MNTKIIVPALLIVAFLRSPFGAAQPGAQLLPPVESVGQEAGGKEKTPPPGKDQKPPEKKLPEIKQPETDAFTQTPAMTSQANTGFNPQMMGDFGIFYRRQAFTVLGTQTTTTTTKIFDISSGVNQIGPTVTTTRTTPVTQTRTLLVPYATSAIKVAENESPRPTNRIFGTYNYFGGLQGGESAGGSAFNAGIPKTTFIGPDIIRTDVTNTTTLFPGTNVTANAHREVVGFEKTFLDGYASIEVRLPFLQTTSNLDGFGGQNVGDVTIVTKYAFLLDNTTGNVFSAGLAVTAPTGPGVDTVDGYLHSTLLQPWFGYIRNFDRFFVQGFHSVVVPTDSRDVTLLFTDVGVNYWLYRGTPDRFLSFIVPLAEIHVTTPLNHRDTDGAIYVPDQVVFTGGAHFGFFRRTTLSLGVATPLTGPRIFNIEGFAQLNWRF